jgi:hypothetical protein
MVDAGKREAMAWRTVVQTGELAKEAQACGLDALAFLLGMAQLEAKQHVVMKGQP